MKPVGILGGTFDPVHHGHLITAQALIEIRNLEKIIFIPCYTSPHKTEVQNSTSDHRLNMVKIAVDGIPHFDYSSFEIEKKGISYTIDTLRELNKQYEKLELIIGYDNIIKFHSWKEPDEILKLAKLVVMKRKSENKDFVQSKYYAAAEFIQTPHIEISATIIRERVKNNLPIDFLVPEKVKEYILSNRLYR